ncbi:MAG: TolC family protein [Gammaproteobacteria bacterium]|nr:TolC family protein [Gammaproteobacteria bacterium]
MKIVKTLLYITVTGLCTTAMAETLTPDQVLQKVIDHYPSINTAAIEIERARQSIKVANSQLGWKLEAQAGVERGVNLLGTASDIVSVGAGISRMLDSGSSLTFDGGVRREDSETILSPAIPNPATSSNFGVSYRQSLAKNTAYSLFEESRTSAKLDLESSLAEREELYDQLANQVMELYFSAATLLARVGNVEQSINRAKRLQSYINNKTSLGISEEKDVLQVDAQLDSLKAENKNLNVLWLRQMVSLNRLMERPWDSGISTTYQANSKTEDFDSLFVKAKNYSPKIKLLETRLAQADSVISTRRDERENAVDLVWFAGGRNYQGDNVTGNTSESELTGGLRLEFKQEINKSGVDAELYQAQLQRGAILQDRKLLLQNLQYELAGLLAEIEANRSSITAYEKSVKSETIKVDEAIKRYRSGRIDTDVLIKFEDQLSQAKFSLELQRISLVRRHYQLQIIQGVIWDKILKPEYHDFLSEPQFRSSVK